MKRLNCGPKCVVDVDSDSINFDSIINQFFNPGHEKRGFSYSGSQNPPVDVKEEKEHYVLKADLPGYTQNDIEILVKEERVTISSVKKEEDEKAEYMVRERRNRSFSRTFKLPDNVDRTKISASFKNGVLTLIMDKIPEAQPRNIKIETN